MSEKKDKAVTGEASVAAARRWRGTPDLHQGRDETVVAEFGVGRFRSLADPFQVAGFAAAGLVAAGFVVAVAGLPVAGVGVFVVFAGFGTMPFAAL